MQEGNEKDCIAVLREHGLQVTYQRLAIYQILLDSKDHPSAEDIYQQVRRRFPMISLGTVYKTLERFHEVALIQRVSPMTDVARYEAKISAHHHLICLECQTIVDLEDPTLDEKIQLPEDNGFQILRRQVVIQGLCPHCRHD
jgi:Fur family transcriptional regulator, peroxide stress response regulator